MAPLPLRVMLCICTNARVHGWLRAIACPWRACACGMQQFSNRCAPSSAPAASPFPHAGSKSASLNATSIRHASHRTFKKLLAANRGEIAIRIMRASAELNIRTTGIFSHEDRYLPHRYKADESYQVRWGPVISGLASLSAVTRSSPAVCVGICWSGAARCARILFEDVYLLRSCAGGGGEDCSGRVFGRRRHHRA